MKILGFTYFDNKFSRETSAEMALREKLSDSMFNQNRKRPEEVMCEIFDALVENNLLTVDQVKNILGSDFKVEE